MEALFENQYKLTRERYLSFYKKPIQLNYMKFVWGAFLVISGVMLIISLIDQQQGYAFYYGIIMLFCVYNVFLRNHLLALRTYKMLVTQLGMSEWERKITIGDKIIMTDMNTISEFHWTQIVKTVVNKEYIALVLTNNLAIRLDKTGFTQGTADTFLAYLKSKNIPIKEKHN